MERQVVCYDFQGLCCRMLYTLHNLLQESFLHHATKYQMLMYYWGSWQISIHQYSYGQYCLQVSCSLRFSVSKGTNQSTGNEVVTDSV